MKRFLFQCFVCFSAFMKVDALANVCDEEDSFDPSRGLVVSNFKLLEDPRNADLLSFETISKSVFKNQNPAFKVKNWFELWSRVTELNQQQVEARSSAMVLSFWPKTNRGELDLKKAPFRLLAVVMRPDQQNAKSPAGEVRFVYSLVNPRDNSSWPFTVIFEFHLSQPRKVWLEKIAKLGESTDPQIHQNFLQEMLNNVLAEGKIGQVRTNDFFMSPEWELREFRLNAGNELEQVPLLQTPADGFNRNPNQMQKLIEFLQGDFSARSNEIFELPMSFRGAVSTAFTQEDKWLVNSNLNEERRQAFGMLTCNGCHSGETDTRFTHISPRSKGESAEISIFLKSEMNHRQTELFKELCGSNRFNLLLESSDRPVSIFGRSVH